MTAWRVVLLSICLTACMTSKPPEKFSGARSVRGVVGSLELRDTRAHSGELLAVDDSAFVILEGDRVGIVRFSDVRSGRFTQMGSASLVVGPNPTPAVLARARMLSRFPYGITATAMRSLLAASKQEVPDDLGRSVP